MNLIQSDKIIEVKISKVLLPLKTAVSDAKVSTGRQKPLDSVALLFAEITNSDGLVGMGFSYALRVGGEGQYAHAKELAPILIGEDPNDIQKIWDKMFWAGASVGRSGIAVQAIAAFDTALWDLKAKKANLPLAKLFGSYRDSVPCYNTSGGYLQASVEEIIEKATASLERGISGVKLKVGQSDSKLDFKRVEAVRKHFGDDVPIMVDANQQWDLQRALQFGRRVEDLNLTWIEEPLSAYDSIGHAKLTSELDTPIATGEMLSSIHEHISLIENESVNIIQPDAPRIGGITPFLKLNDLAYQANLGLAPHFVMEIHVHLSAAYPTESWVEHFEWLEPLFEERLEIKEGRMFIPNRAGLGLTISDVTRKYTLESHTFN